MSQLYLGVDVGTASTKCLVVDESGELRAFSQQAYALSHPSPGWAEQDPEDYWRALLLVVSACVRQCLDAGATPADFAALALSTQGDTLVLADAEGVALGPALSWMDTRGAEEHRALLAQTDQAFWYHETGLPLVPGSSACKLRWVAAHRPDLYARVQRIGAVPDYLAARLCGQFVTDTPSASWSPYFTPPTRAWSRPVMDLLGVTEAQLPRVVESGTVLGPLLPEIATQVGLTPDTLLVAGAFDQAAAALGAGAAPGQRSVLSCGTAWVLYTVAEAPPADPDAMLPLCCHTTPCTWGALLPFTGSAAYDWLQRTFRLPGGAACDASEPLFFMPFLYGAGPPDWRAEVRGALFGLTMAHTSADVELAVLRALACETRRCLETLEAVCGPLTTLRMVGGAARSPLLPRLVADALGRPLEVSELSESAAYGAARLAAGPRAATWPEPAPLSPVTPEASRVAEFAAYYAEYQRYRSALLALDA